MHLNILKISLLLAMTVSSWACPEQCQCQKQGSNFFVDCSDQSLSELPDFEDMSIQHLDLSNNQFTEYPIELSKYDMIEFLDLSSNGITQIPGDALTGMLSLRHLSLAKNNISNWMDINPNILLLPATNLFELNLSKNLFTSLSSINHEFVLMSNSLRFLDLSECKISKISGQMVVQGLTNLDHLKLSHNPLKTIPSLVSPSLATLDLSSCHLSTLNPTLLEHMPAITYIKLARNHRISLFNRNDFVRSDSLKKIDLSNCNMDNIELDGFPNLMTAVLRGNLIRQLDRESFVRNKVLENLDLSLNSIGSIDPFTFREMKHLKHLDLSFNMISRVERDTFKMNEVLTSINLSRNYIARLNRIVGASVATLNMSWCEILSIEADALSGMPDLVELDLSNNLISLIPDNLESPTLQTLDLSMCRLSIIRNETFASLPELMRLNLSGNRFTTTFRREFFTANRYIEEIWMGDNPWRCDCRDESFLEFFNFLTDPPGKIWDRRALRCTSPEEKFGLTWERACLMVWYPPEAAMGSAEKVWTFLMVGIITFSMLMCIIMTVKRAIVGRKRQRAEREREAVLEERRDVTRQNRMRMDQEAQLNAPDPRDSRPPCYEDALLMPRLDGSFASLDELGTSRSKRHRRKKDEDVENEDDIELRRTRCRSEEVLSMRGTLPQARPDRVSNQVQARVHTANAQIRQTQPPPPPVCPPPNFTPRVIQSEEIHYHSTDILSLNHNIPEATATSSANGPRLPNADSIKNFQSNETSPYAKRKNKFSTFKNPTPHESPEQPNTSSRIQPTPPVVPGYHGHGRERVEHTNSIYSGISQLSDDSERHSYATPSELEHTKNLINRQHHSPDMRVHTRVQNSVAEVHQPNLEESSF